MELIINDIYEFKNLKYRRKSEGDWYMTLQGGLVGYITGPKINNERIELLDKAYKKLTKIKNYDNC